MYKVEVYDYKTQLMVNIDDIIPLFDLCDHVFIIYNIEKMNTIDEIIYKDVENIEKYIDLLK